MRIERAIEVATIVLSVGALVLLVLNFFQNPVEAKRAELQAELENLDGRTATTGTDEFLWPFSEWQSAIKGNPKVWSLLVEPPKQRTAEVKLTPAPSWDALLKGVRVLRREIGGSPKVVYPGSAPDGDYVPIGTKINGCVLESFDRMTATFSHHWPLTNETRTHTVQRELK